MYWVFLSNCQCYCTSYRSSKQNYLVICKSIGFEELNDSRCIFLDVLRSSLALVDTITSILHRQDRIPCLQTNQPYKFISRTDIFSIGVKKHNDLGLSSSQEQTWHVLITTNFLLHIQISLHHARILILCNSLRIWFFSRLVSLRCLLNRNQILCKVILLVKSTLSTLRIV